MLGSVTRICAVGVLTAGLAAPARGVLLQWEQTVPAGDWHANSNWFYLDGGVKTSGWVPTAADTVYLGGYSDQTGIYKINLSGDAVAKNLAGDDINHSTLHYDLDLGGHTLTIANHSHLKGNVTITNGFVTNGVNGWNIGKGLSPTVVTIGTGADLQIGGASHYDYNYSNLAVFEQAELVVDGGSITATRQRGMWVMSEATLSLKNGGTIRGGRDLTNAASGAMKFTLDGTSYTGTTAGISMNWNVHELGDLVIDLAPSYVHSYGQRFNLIEYRNEDAPIGGTYHGLFDTFNGLAEGAIVSVQGNDFILSYGDRRADVITLTAVPEPSTLAFLGCAGLAFLGRRR